MLYSPILNLHTLIKLNYIKINSNNHNKIILIKINSYNKWLKKWLLIIINLIITITKNKKINLKNDLINHSLFTTIFIYSIHQLIN
jgi:hypothetical protein